MLNISYNDFKNLLFGVKVIVTADNVGTPQCVDPVQLWAKVLGAPRFTGNAEDIYNQPGNTFTQIANTPTNYPSKGDVVVLSKKYNNTVGHVVLCDERSDMNSFDGFGQNNPTGSDCGVKTYKYTNAQGEFVVTGWLHPKN